MLFLSGHWQRSWKGVTGYGLRGGQGLPSQKVKKKRLHCTGPRDEGAGGTVFSRRSTINNCWSQKHASKSLKVLQATLVTATKENSPQTGAWCDQSGEAMVSGSFYPAPSPPLLAFEGFMPSGQDVLRVTSP